jgi:TPR repeat protein
MALFEQAAAKDHAGAKFALGVLHTGRLGIDANLPTARKWFFAAAQQGHAQSQHVLGQMLANGAGGPADLRDAIHWLKRADAAGIAEARGDLEKLQMRVDHLDVIVQRRSDHQIPA